MRDNFNGKHSWNRQVIQEYRDPILENAGFRHLQGSLFNSAIMKTCVISPMFRRRYLENPKDPNAFEGPVVVFDGPEERREGITGEPAQPTQVLGSKGVFSRRRRVVTGFL